MNSIHLNDIIIKPNRQRQEFEPEALQELKNSIEDRGLMHAPVLRKEGSDWVLVAGERRLKAMSEIFELGGQFWYDGADFKDGVVPFVDLGTLSPLEAEEAELDENLRRRDLTWQEHAAAVSRLHNLRQAQQAEHNDIVAGGLDTEGKEIPQLPPHTIADTAQEITGRRDGAYQDSVRKELIVSQHLNNPVIAKAKSADEAFKLLRKDEDRKRNLDLAAIVGASFDASLHKVFNVNCLHWMEDSPPEIFDVILTDPPYGMDAQSFGDGAGRLAGIDHQYDDSYDSWKRLMEGYFDSKDAWQPGWCELAFRIAKPQAHAYVFCDIDRFHELKGYMEEAGWYVFRTPMINVKTNSGRVPLPDQGPRRQYEILLYAIKGKKPVTHIYPDVITSVMEGQVLHGAQKPISLYQNLLQRSVRPGDSVLDSFSGSGTIFPAAHSLKCLAVGLEQNPEYYALNVKQLRTLLENDNLGLEGV